MDFIIQKAYAASAGVLNNPTGSNSGMTFDKLYQNVLSQIVNPIIYLLFALAVVYFVWGVMEFIRNADNSEKKADGYKHMIWGIVGIFIMVSAKGLINLILATFGLK